MQYLKQQQVQQPDLSTFVLHKPLTTTGSKFLTRSLLGEKLAGQSLRAKLNHLSPCLTLDDDDDDEDGDDTINKPLSESWEAPINGSYLHLYRLVLVCLDFTNDLGSYN
ncbi:hypothetical protein V6N11_076138 [Hibiscus sabdariffa]|uniref:Uncharacterized protein n=1 Tax=Hibiscus sabdariffa TaxID=183260 RepID=A0ABR2Q5U3_9ROSI